MATSSDETLDRICRELRGRQRLLLTSHVRPDGDAIGSQMALAYALRALDKQVRIVNRDPAPPAIARLPGVGDIEIAEHVHLADADAVVVLECADLSRTGVAGLERFFVINIDHHPGNALYGAINWFDPTAAACGEMVFDLITRLGVPLGREIATHIYLAILTDTGSFHYSNISPSTFEICRRTLEAGIDPVWIARTVYDDNTVGRLKLFGAVLGAMEVDPGGRLAVLRVDREMARRTGGTYEDTEGLANQPLTVKEIQAVAFFKEWDGGTYRVSLRSKGEIDVGQVAKRFGGGGHRNAAGCTVPGPYEAARSAITRLVLDAMDTIA